MLQIAKIYSEVIFKSVDLITRFFKTRLRNEFVKHAESFLHSWSKSYLVKQNVFSNLPPNVIC